MLIVNVEKSGGIERALKKLKSKFKLTRMNNELRERKHFTKPSVEKRNEKSRAIHLDKKNRENNEDFK